MAPLPYPQEHHFPLAGETADPGHGGLTGEDAAAAGNSSGGVSLSHGGLIAIIVVVVVVAIMGTGSAILFYLTKKKEWKLREKMRRSAKRMVTALTPRRSEFPSHLKGSGDGGGKEARNVKTRLEDVPPTPRFRPEDLEKSIHGAEKDGEKKKKMRWPGH